MSLRLRLLVAVGLIAIVALVVADFATYSALRSSLYNQVDQQLAQNAQAPRWTPAGLVFNGCVPRCRRRRRRHGRQRNSGDTGTEADPAPVGHGDRRVPQHLRHQLHRRRERRAAPSSTAWSAPPT